MITLENVGLGTQEVVLKSRSVNPFNAWADWYGTGGEAVVTFFTMTEHLWDRWSSDCVHIDHGEECDHDMDTLDELNERINCDNTERVVEPEKFDASKLSEPGIYLDGTHYEKNESVDESYTIIVPYPFLSPKLCREWIEKLNEQYARNFHLEITEDQKRHAPGWEQMGINRMRLYESNNLVGDDDE